MHNLARAQSRYDRKLHSDFADTASTPNQRPMTPHVLGHAALLDALREDIATDLHADADISTAFIEHMYDANDRNAVLFMLLADTQEEDERALRHLKAGLLLIAHERATKPNFLDSTHAKTL